MSILLSIALPCDFFSDIYPYKNHTLLSKLLDWFMCSNPVFINLNTF